MSKIIGKIIGGVAAGAFAIGGAVTISQLDTQTAEINKKVDEMSVLAEKIGQEYYCYAVDEECVVVEGMEEADYEFLNAENDLLFEEYNLVVDKYNNECVGDGIDSDEEQKCLELNNAAAKMVDELHEQLEKLDTFVADIAE